MERGSGGGIGSSTNILDWSIDFDTARPGQATRSFHGDRWLSEVKKGANECCLLCCLPSLVDCGSWSVKGVR